MLKDILLYYPPDLLPKATALSEKLKTKQKEILLAEAVEEKVEGKVTYYTVLEGRRYDALSFRQLTRELNTLEGGNAFRVAVLLEQIGEEIRVLGYDEYKPLMLALWGLIASSA